MAIGTAVNAINAGTDGQIVIPTSFTSRWTTIIDAGGVASLDNAALTNPVTQIVNSTSHPIRRAGVGNGSSGTNLILQLGYSASATVSANPVLVAFGFDTSEGAIVAGPTRLTTYSGATSVTLATSSIDSTDGTLKYTIPYRNDWFDCQGFDTIYVGVQTALAVSAGSTATAIVRGRFA